MLLAIAMVGTSHILFLPPWEGFDEYAHWSSIQQIADTGRIPYYGIAHISEDVESYTGPMPYASIPPFDKTGSATYASFRESGVTALPETGERHFRPGQGLNWQAQHPPLYYLIMAPIYLLTKSLSWTENLLALRLASWCLAFAGLALGVLVTEHRLGKIGVRAAPVMAAYPFLVPEFFPEMARLGNDSLCLLVMGCVWTLLLRLLSPERGAWTAPMLGFALGVGLWTKAFFVPISVGVAAFLMFRWLMERHRDHVRDVLLCALVALSVGGLWYVRNLILFDNLLGSNDFIRLANGIGLRAGLEQNFSLLLFAKGFAAMIGTYIWAGTWSLAQPPEYVLVPTAMLIALTIGAYLLHLRRDIRPGRMAFILPLFLVAPVAAGLTYHLVTVVAETGRPGGTPGWYLHILAAPIGFAMAMGWSMLRPATPARILAAGSVALGVVSWGLQLSLFSGCALKIGEDRHYNLADATCRIAWSQLEKLAYPGIASFCLMLGTVFAVAALFARHPQLEFPRTTIGSTDADQI